MQDCIRKIFIYFHCYGLRRLFVHPLPIPISCILRGCCFLALFIFDETIDSTKWWIHCFIRTTSSTRQAIGLDYFIFICKFHYEAGGRAPTVIFFLSQTRNDRKWTTYPLSTTSNKSHRIIVRKKNLRTHFIWAVGLLGMPMLVCVCVCGIVPHVVDWKQHTTNGQAFASAFKMIACVYDSMGDSRGDISWDRCASCECGISNLLCTQWPPPSSCKTQNNWILNRF